MIPLRTMAVLVAVAVVGVGVDVVTGADLPGYGAGLGAAGVIVLTVGSGLLERALRRDNADLDPCPDGSASQPDAHQEGHGG